MFRRRQVSTIGMMVATLGPASWLPRWIQFLRPRATGRIAFSARLLESSNSGYSRKRLSRLQSVSVSQETHWEQIAAVVIIKSRGQVDTAHGDGSNPVRPWGQVKSHVL